MTDIDSWKSWLPTTVFETMFVVFLFHAQKVCGTGNQITPNISFLMGPHPPSVILSLTYSFICGSVASNINTQSLYSLRHISMAPCGCCGVHYGLTPLIAICINVHMFSSPVPLP